MPGVIELVLVVITAGVLVIGIASVSAVIALRIIATCGTVAPIYLSAFVVTALHRAVTATIAVPDVATAITAARHMATITAITAPAHMPAAATITAAATAATVAAPGHVPAAAITTAASSASASAAAALNKSDCAAVSERAFESGCACGLSRLPDES
jgi:hypothetical protein